MAKKLSKLKGAKKKKIDLVNYQIWWVHHNDLKNIVDIPVGDLDKLPTYVIDEINDLLWEEAYKRTSLSVPDALGINELALTEVDQLATARRLASGKYYGFVGIMVYHEDVTSYMYNNGMITNYLGERQYLTGKTLSQRIVQFEDEVRALTEPLQEEVSTGKPLGKRVSDLEETVRLLSAISTGVKDLTQYQIWWLDYDTLEGFKTWPPGKLLDKGFLPRYVYREVYDLLHDERYLSTGTAFPAELGIDAGDWSGLEEVIGVNILRHGLMGHVGIVVRTKDVTEYMRGIGRYTDHLVQPILTGKEKYINIRDYAIWWLTYGELELLADEVEGMSAVSEGYMTGLTQFSKNSYHYLQDAVMDQMDNDRCEVGEVMVPKGLDFTIEDWERETGYKANRFDPTLEGRYGIVIKRSHIDPLMEEMGIVTDHTHCRLTDPAAKLHAQLVKAAQPEPKKKWNTMSPSLEALVKERIADDAPVRIYRPDPKSGGWMLDSVVEPPADDVERDCCDAKETFCIWWLGQDENKAVNQAMREGKIRLPAYIADEVRRFEDCITIGKVSIYHTFPHEVKEIIDESDSEDNIDVNGIVIMNVDAYGVEKHGGTLTTLDMKAFSVDTHLAEELAIHKKPYTDEEIRELFLAHVRGLIQYWGEIHPTNGKEAASGIAHSICVAIAGNSMNLPGFRLVPMGTQEDNEYRAENGERPWPVVPPEIADSLPDGGAYLHEGLYHPAEKPVAQCEFWLTKDQWRQGMHANKWAWCYEVMLKETQFIKDRYATEHPGTVLANAYRDLCRVCLKHGAYFVPDEWDVLDKDYSFKWVTDDPDVFQAMLSEMSGYTLRGHF